MKDRQWGVVGEVKARHELIHSGRQSNLKCDNSFTNNKTINMP